MLFLLHIPYTLYTERFHVFAPFLPFSMCPKLFSLVVGYGHLWVLFFSSFPLVFAELPQVEITTILREN